MKTLLITLSFFLVGTCTSKPKSPDPAAHYRAHGDIASLQAAFQLIPEKADTTILKNILGEGANFGFDYRYYSDSIGPKGCPVAAVFWIDQNGQVTNREIFEVCE
ncbi:MAG TPA: hypothetical protein ENK85_02205 [Saprospiraceae bacterium]|nr:hypothetical protein [Saprospiraceae bacterium]